MGKLNDEEIELNNLKINANDDEELNSIVNKMNDFNMQNGNLKKGKLEEINLNEDDNYLNDNQNNKEIDNCKLNDNEKEIKTNVKENNLDNKEDKSNQLNNHFNQQQFLNNNDTNIISTDKLDAHSSQNEMLKNSIKLFKNEFKRLGFDEKYWRYTSFNKNFTLCSTYPPYFIIPAQFKDDDLIEVAKFRHINRLPSIVYRHRNGSVIVRSSQPNVGILYRRSLEDEKLLQLIFSNCLQDQEELLNKSSNSLSSLLGENKLNNKCDDCCLNNNENNSNDNSNQNNDPSSSNCKCNHKESLPIKNCQPTQSSKFFGLSDKIFENLMSYTSYNDNNNQTSSTNNHKNRKLLIFDARSFTVAVLNRAFGGGSECSEYYPNCDVQFLYLANIHAVRAAFLSLKQLIKTDNNQYPNYFSNWSKSNYSYWLYYISNLIESALKVVFAIDHDARPVLIHCSDGWDRTSQIVSLAELMLDPFYRTIEGFQVLVQREWLDFGHKFADRCGISPVSKNINERSPIFIQFLDSVYQIVQQCPDYFEFNCTYLEELALHTYSPLFGTFSCNSYLERFINQIHGETTSVWSYLEKSKDKFINENYVESMKVLEPSYSITDMVIWKELYQKLITDEFESRFDIKPTSTQTNTNQIISKNQTDHIRKRKLFKAYSFTLSNQPKKEIKNLRRVKSENDLLNLNSKKLSNDELPLPLNKFQQQKNGLNELKSLNFLHSHQQLDPQHQHLNSNQILNNSNNKTCKFQESKTNRGIMNADVELPFQVPISVLLPKIAQLANSNPDSSLMYSILAYVNTNTFSVK